MGNRFFTLGGYQNLVKAHGILAAITFLGLIPFSIFFARFLVHGRNPRFTRKLHIWLNILALLLFTVQFILGFLAVGPERSLSNPHHGIGVALYTLFWVEIIQGCLIRKRWEGSRARFGVFTGMLHAWLGRAIALLGIAQVALGLTLYGSPEFLFILYALFVFALIVAYFVLEWLHERRRDSYASDGGSYYSDEVVSARPQHEHGGWGKLAAAGAGGAGLAALWSRRKSNQRDRPDVVGTESSATSYMTDEKYGRETNHHWGRKLLEVGALAGGIAAVKNIFGRKSRDDESVAGPYRPPLGGNQSVTTSDTMSRVEEGRPPMQPTTPPGVSPGYVRPSHPLAQTPMTPGRPGAISNSSYSYGSYISGSPSRQDRRHHTFRDALAAGGAAFAVKSLFKNRRQKKEETRAEELRTQRMEEERVARMDSAHKYTGDGAAPRRHGRIGSQSASDASSILQEHDIRPGAGTASAAAAGALADRDRIRPVGTDPTISMPGPPMGPPMSTPANFPPANYPPAPPMHGTDLSSGSERYTTASGRQRHRHHLRDEAAAGLAGAGLGAAGVEAARRRRSGQNTDSMESPPVSVKVKMHNDGRHVTLRRLTEEEAAAQRRQERRASQGARRRRNSSFSSSSGGEALGVGPSGDNRWRRTEALEAQQAAHNQTAVPSGPPPMAPYPTPPTPGNQAIDPRTGQSYHMPVPPPIPGSSPGSNLGPAGSTMSPGTETSGPSEYANNRRRRRAERAQARLAREGRAQNTVDFT